MNRPITFQMQLAFLGIVAWLVAGGIYLSTEEYQSVVQEPIRSSATGNVASGAVAVAPNMKSGLGTAGFAIAGGLCFLASALASGGRSERPGTKPES